METHVAVVPVVVAEVGGGVDPPLVVGPVPVDVVFRQEESPVDE